MALLLETTLGDLVIDLDVEGSPELCKNILKLAKARYYTSTLVYNVQPNRFCQLGDPRGNGSGGGCIYGLLDAHKQAATTTTTASALRTKTHESDVDRALTQSRHRFLKSNMGRALTKEESQEKGRIVATEMNGIPDTIGSQLLITISSGQGRALDGYQQPSGDGSGGDLAAASTADRGGSSSSSPTGHFRSVGRVVEDDKGVLDQIAAAYCDADGRPYADVRIIRALVIDDPFPDPPGMDQLMKDRGVEVEPPSGASATATDKEQETGNDNDNDNQEWRVTASPDYERPPEETVDTRIQADQVDQDTEADAAKLRQQEEDMLKREDKSRAVVLEMLGDLPSADIQAPENVLFVCKLNPVTEDEDLELIFSRFDEQVKAEIIRDQETGSSLQYAFLEFRSKDRAVEAYFKMNNALVDDRRIKVDFSQSVAKVWDRYRQKGRRRAMPKDPYAESKAKPRHPQPPPARPAPRRHDNNHNMHGRHSRNDRDNRGNGNVDIRHRHHQHNSERNKEQVRHEDHHRQRNFYSERGRDGNQYHHDRYRRNDNDVRLHNSSRDDKVSSERDRFDEMDGDRHVARRQRSESPNDSDIQHEKRKHKRMHSSSENDDDGEHKHRKREKSPSSRERREKKHKKHKKKHRHRDRDDERKHKRSRRGH